MLINVLLASSTQSTCFLSKISVHLKHSLPLNCCFIINHETISILYGYNIPPLKNGLFPVCMTAFCTLKSVCNYNLGQLKATTFLKLAFKSWSPTALLAIFHWLPFHRKCNYLKQFPAFLERDVEKELIRL